LTDKEITMATIGQTLIERIRSLRERHGLTQAQVAEHLDISRSSFAQIEMGQRGVTAEELVTLARLFHVTCEELLDPKKEPQVRFEYVNRSSEQRVSEPPMRISVPQKNLKKFREVLLYILNEVGSKPNIGETVIYKLLYFIDFDYYEKYEEQLIGATYLKNHYGPTPVEFKKIVDQMVEEGKIIKVRSEYFKHPQTKYLPVERPDLSILRALELELIDDVLARLSDMNAKQISEYSHKDVPWMTTDEGKAIDYEKVFYRTVPYSVREYDNDEEE
jgi:transcriptional regulator with XRE-family HTH domain